MQSKDMIALNLERSMNRTLRAFESMKEAPFTFPTPNGGCHPMWILGHLAFSEGQTIRETMLGEPNPLDEWKDIFGKDTEALADPAKYPSFDEAFDRCREIRGATITLLDSFAEEDLDTTSKNAPELMVNTFGTYRLCFQFVSDHWYMHRGQIADARRAIDPVA